MHTFNIYSLYFILSVFLECRLSITRCECRDILFDYEVIISAPRTATRRPSQGRSRHANILWPGGDNVNIVYAQWARVRPKLYMS